MKIGIIGAAGSVGAPAAFYIAVSGLASEVVLIDIRPNVVQQHAMDLSTAVSRLDVRVKAGGFEDLAGTRVIVNAAGVPQGVIADRMEMLPKNISIVKDTALKLKRYCPDAIIITATNPVDPLNYTTWRAGGFERNHVLGYTVNDSFRFRELVARTKGVKVRQVQATVIGEHGSSQVPLFSSVRIDGGAVTFGEDEKQAILSDIPKILMRFEELQAGRTAGWTCAVGLAGMVQAIRADSGEVFPCSVVLEGEYGQRGVSMAVPVALGKDGAREVQEWELAPEERAGFEKAAGVQRAAVQTVEDNL
jgi:malate dehydrogenase